MNISENLTQQQLREILLDIMAKGNQAQDINVNEMVNDIKEQVLTAIMR